MTPSARLLAIALLPLLAACAGPPETELPADATTPPPDAAAAPAAEPRTEAGTGDEATPPPADPIRADGRPDWWFDGVQQADGRATLCAEALGATMRSAAQAAVSAARRSMIAAGARAERLTVERTLVWPLPTPSTSGARYAGYVLASAPTR